MDRFQFIEAYHRSHFDQERYSDSQLTHSELLYDLLQNHTRGIDRSFWEVGHIHSTFEKDGYVLILREHFKPAIAPLTAMVLITSTAISLIRAPQESHKSKVYAYEPPMLFYSTVILHELIWFVLLPGKFQPSKIIVMSSWLALVLAVYPHRYTHFSEGAAPAEPRFGWSQGWRLATDIRTLLCFDVYVSLQTLGLVSRVIAKVIRVIAQYWIFTTESGRMGKKFIGSPTFHTVELSSKDSGTWFFLHAEYNRYPEPSFHWAIDLKSAQVAQKIIQLRPWMILFLVISTGIINFVCSPLSWKTWWLARWLTGWLADRLT